VAELYTLGQMSRESSGIPLWGRGSDGRRIIGMKGLLRLREPANQVSRKAIWYWSAKIALGWTVVIAGQVLWAVLADDGSPVRIWFLAASGVLAVADLIVEPRWRYRVHHWETTEDAIYTKSGWLHQVWRIAPLARVQTVDSHRGPFELLLGLANVTVTTASAAGPVRIEGLDQPTAQRLVDELTTAARLSTQDAT
jgi:membrane protein YdbS with pleckstrin-like domain